MRKRISGLMAFVCLLVAAASALAAGTTVTTFTPFADMDFAAQGYMDLITAWEDETGNMVEDYSGLEDDLFMEQMQEMVTAGRADLVVVPLGSGLTKDQLVSVDELLAAAPDVVIDVGEPKGSIVEDMDALQEQTGIPFVHIDAYLAAMDDTYAMLGDLLAMPNEAQGLADYCRYAYDRAVEIANSVEKANLLYITGDEGLNVIAKGSYHAEAIDLLANNLAVVEEPSSKGTGNEVDMEQILNWNPDVILFAPGSIYASVGSNENWQTVTAIKNGAYYEVPMGPYNWMGFPPSVQRLLGMTWMAKILYPTAADYDLYTEVSTYFQLFYHCELTQEQYDALVGGSAPLNDQAA